MASERLRVLLDGTPLLGAAHRGRPLHRGAGRGTGLYLRSGHSRGGVHAARLATRCGTCCRTGSGRVACRVRRGCCGRCWVRTTFPPVELFAGFSDVVHGTNFVLPVAARAARRADHPRPRLLRRARRTRARATTNCPCWCAGRRARARSSARRRGSGREGARTARCARGEDRGHPARGRPGVVRRAPPDRRPACPSSACRASTCCSSARTGPRKGLGLLRRAHASAPSLPPLVLAGPGSGRRGGRVVPHRLPVRGASLRSVVAGAAAVVLPSRDEGFGLPVLEALACNVPGGVLGPARAARGRGRPGDAGALRRRGGLGAALVEALADPPSLACWRRAARTRPSSRGAAARSRRSPRTGGRHTARPGYGS